MTPLRGHKNYIHDLQYFGTTVVTASEDSTLKVWSVRNEATGKRGVRAQHVPLEGHTAGVTKVVVGNNLIASLGNDRTARYALLFVSE